MTTYDDLLDRLDNEWLYPPQAQPVVLHASGATAAGTKTVTVDTSLMTPEEEVLLGPGAIIENIETHELMYLESYTAPDLTVRRGQLGTADQDITDGDTLRVNPNFPRSSCLKALGDVTVDCSPPLWVQKDDTVTIPTTGYADAPADMLGLLGAQYQHNNRWWEPQIQFFRSFPAAGTNKALFIGGHSGKTVYLTYKAAPTRPTSGSDALPRDDWEKLLIVGAVAELVGSVDIDQLTAEFITAKLEIENVPVGTGVSLRSALSRHYRNLLTQAKRRQARETDGGGIRVTVNGKYV